MKFKNNHYILAKGLDSLKHLKPKKRNKRKNTKNTKIQIALDEEGTYIL